MKINSQYLQMIKKIFRGKNVWIRDIAATCDVTFRKSVMTNTETPKEYSEVVA